MVLGPFDPLELLPHREPFVFLTKITEVKALSYAKGYWDIPEDFYVFKGHFPNYPVLPGVLIVESIAQLGAAALRVDEKFKDKLVFFGGIDKARFRKQVTPGSRLNLSVEVTHLSNLAGKAKGEAYLNDSLACEAHIVFVVAK